MYANFVLFCVLWLQVIWMLWCGCALTSWVTQDAPALSPAKAAVHRQQRKLRGTAWQLVTWRSLWSSCCWLGSWTRPLTWLLQRAQWMCLHSWWQTTQR
jgi:hypothetical protein